MGNKLGRRRQVVEDRFTKPQGLYVHKDVDHKKLKKLILESKLAPCYPGDEECCCDLEECPICFLYYPSLNRSRCCMKGICTECFLQMKNPNSARPTQCPFCKTSNYAVEYRGLKTKEEKGLEQIEEQRVIEAKIKMRQQEIQDEEERMQKRLHFSSSGSSIALGATGQSSVAAPSYRPTMEDVENTSSQDSSIAPMCSQPSQPRANRDDEFDLDLEDIMFMEAIWLSVQDNGRQGIPAYDDDAPEEQNITEGRFVSPTLVPVAVSSSSPSGGLACAIAALAERQQIGGDSSINHNGSISALSMLPGSNTFYNRVGADGQTYPPVDSYVDLSHHSGMAVTRNDDEWGLDHGSEVAEAGTSYASSDGTEDAGGALPSNGGIVNSFQNAPGAIIPESYEEQMMLAMAVSLTEAQAVTSGSRVAWQ